MVEHTATDGEAVGSNPSGDANDPYKRTLFDRGTGRNGTGRMCGQHVRSAGNRGDHLAHESKTLSLQMDLSNSLFYLIT